MDWLEPALFAAGASGTITFPPLAPVVGVVGVFLVTAYIFS